LSFLLPTRQSARGPHNPGAAIPLLEKPSDTGIDQGKEVNRLAEEQNETNETAEAVASDEVTSEETSTTEAAAPEAAEASDESAPVTTETAAPSDRTYYGSAAGQPELSDALSQKVDSNEPLKEVEGGRAYEIIYIGRIGDAEATEATSVSLKALVDEFGGAIDNVRASEARRLAYPIKREVEGLYTVVNARLAPSHLPEVDRFFKLEESVLRHMILKEN
jgi:small subunit ribosomal protein S6